MAEGGRRKSMDFVPMKTIGKVPDDWDGRCTDWVATEKVHGSSFQLYTEDGITIHTGSRRRNLDHEESFLKCRIQEFVAEHREYVTKFWQAIASDDRWNRHREIKKSRESEQTNTLKSSLNNNCESVFDTSTIKNTPTPSTNTLQSSINNCESEVNTSTTNTLQSSINNNCKSEVDTSTIKNTTTASIAYSICTQENANNKNAVLTRCSENDATAENQNNVQPITTTTIDQPYSNISSNHNNSHASSQSTSTLDESGVVLQQYNNPRGPEKTEEARDNGDKLIQLRIYGELYGGGGVDANTKQAIQKEIVYSDEFRFYVFGATINRKWLTISELGDLCRQAGFPYYAKPANEIPMATVEDLKHWLDDNGLMRSRSTLTDSKDDRKTFVEGFVMTPLTKDGYQLHAVKYLAPAFNDVRTEQRTNKKSKVIYCTKQRYHSVISKLDESERRDLNLVVDMMIADMIKESRETDPSKKQQKTWKKMVTQWLSEDGYLTMEDEAMSGRRSERRKEEEEE